MSDPGPRRLSWRDRQEFVRAFDEHVWAQPGAERPLARPATVAVVGSIASVLALLVGVVLQLAFPPSEATATTTPPAEAYTAVAGWDCESTADHGFDVTGRTPEWTTMATGAWNRDGCHGTFQTIPMSGDPDRGTARQAAMWWFLPGPEYTRCELAVYVPVPERPQDAAGQATYVVRAGRSGGTLAEQVVDQAAAPGQWVAIGTFPTTRNGLALALGDQGVPTTPTSRLAVAQARVTCSS
ncbi:hypothetical protein [Rhizomonospora bruguierae]|uniref:hypothetical protein n=1 Tax=Rhizomonospora bruguierae TaxID=1581705 RepID=UPI001BCFA119|nr:hypothetical protein [Micromonospora sp. NBRC 107566]